MIYQDYSIRPLAAAVILQAAREAREGSQDARQWLQTDAPLWMDAIGLDLQPAQVRKWITRGCKIPNRGAARLGF